MKNIKKTLFVNYDIACSLKELGFDYPCIGWYDHDGDFHMLGQGDEDQKSDYIHVTANVDEIVQAPLYQQVISWLIDEKGFIISNLEMYNDEEFGLQIEYTLGNNNLKNLTEIIGVSDSFKDLINDIIVDCIEMIEYDKESDVTSD